MSKVWKGSGAANLVPLVMPALMPTAANGGLVLQNYQTESSVVSVKTGGV